MATPNVVPRANTEGGLGTINASSIDIENDNTWGTGTYGSGTWSN